MAEEVGKPELTLLEETLRSVAKLLKAVRFYPPGHPTLKRTAEEAHYGFVRLLQNRSNVLVAVGKEGFLLGDKPVARDNPILQKLAAFLFSRRLNRLMILPDISKRDLLAFTRCLILEPEEIRKFGGIQEVLIKAHVSTLWVNVTELDQILVRKEELDEEKRALLGDDAVPPEEKDGFFPGAGASLSEDANQASTTTEERPEAEQDLAKILKELQLAETDQRYRLLLQELIPLVRLNLTEASRHLILKALNLLCRNATNRQLPMPRREHSLHALNQLTSDDVLDFLVAFLCTKGVPEEVRRRIIRILVFLKEKVVHRLMDHLAEESDAQARKFLTEALISQGEVAVPVLASYLADERWFVVRNAVAILGEIRSQEAIGFLSPLLGHRDLRVRRETIRAFTKIGGLNAVQILLQTVEGSEAALRRQALLSLGAMKNPAAVPTLLKLVRRPDPFVKRAEVKKEAIKALGEIGSVEAAPTLQAILKHRKLWKRSRFDEVRRAAALALGEIGDEGATALLETTADDRSELVARGAIQALKLLKKAEDHG